MNYWTSVQSGLACTIPRLTAWWSGLTRCSRTRFVSSCTRIAVIGINGWALCCLQCGRFPRPLQDFLPLNSCSAENHWVSWTWLRKTWRRVQAPAKMRYNTSWTCEQISIHWVSYHGRICSRPRNVSSMYNRGAKLTQFSLGDKVLLLVPSSCSKLLAKWQGPFVVTRLVGDADYDVVRSDRGGATQIYHLNLLKDWREVTAVSLAITVVLLHCVGLQVRWVNIVLCGLSQGQQGVQVRCLSNVPGRRHWTLVTTLDLIPGKRQPSPLCTVCTNLSHFRLDCSGPQLHFSASWIGYCGLTLHMLRPIWMW